MYESPKISIIVPVYNVAAYLPACLESISQQTLKGIEVIIINDGSTDNSQEIINAFKAQNPHFICIEQANGGIGKAHNAGLRIAAGEYVCFVDADDYVSPQYCEKLWEAARRAQADICFSRMDVYDEQTGKTSVADEGVFSSLVLAGSRKAEVFSHIKMSMSLCGRITRREIFLKNNIRMPEVRVHEDILPAVALLVSSSLITSEPDAIYYYRINRPGSAGSAQEHTFKELFDAFNAARNFLFEKGMYEVYAREFEYMRFVCILSFIFTYGLNEANWTLMKENRACVTTVHGKLFKGRGLNFRTKFVTLKTCLKHGVNTYPVLARRAQRYLYNPLKKFFGKS